ncbi:MAG: DNA/RNA nuclease SfsA, partial [Lachnospiraceae bacterium]|nr:DNA/RNA nuclease SfsA [Lachnospiraceae bacterium]
MQYQHIVQADFLERPNRFIAHVELDGRRETVHVKNTGRCKELLLPGATVYLEKSDNPARATAYDLVAVRKGGRMINIDSQATNKAVGEWLQEGGLFHGLLSVRPETKYGNSRFDFYVETETEKVFLEVKGVTLEENGVVRFPDAPSERAVKHVEELIAAKHAGYRALLLFVIQMQDVRCFMPHVQMQAAFGEALCRARAEGVEILAYDCVVTEDSMTIHAPVPVYLTEEEHLKENLRLGDLKSISKPLLAWYDNNKRVLPWREEPTPYRVWVSEIMLQQTRVEAVKPYFERFMNSLPDIETLANAPEEELLKLWEGLGYYNRVRNLKKAAIQIMEQYDGRMPEEFEELLRLKGIGTYTAGAISSIAYGKVNPAVDGNVLRVLSRIRKDTRLISEAKVKTAIEQEVRAVIPQDRPGAFNQAMMELGACVCVPGGAPKCAECPLEAICMAHDEGVELDYPRKASSKPRTIE